MILVTNDDGVDSPGLSALARALKSVDEVCVIAPNRNWTAAGHTKTLDRPLRVTEIKLPGTRLQAYSSDGSPSDCVALGFLGLAPERPRLVVSGINTGPNMGRDITHSGTLSGRLGAAVAGVSRLRLVVRGLLRVGLSLRGPVRRETGAARAARRTRTRRPAECQ